jgi:hypothetical protein
MTLLTDSAGNTFASGSTPLNVGSAKSSGSSDRFILQVEIAGLKTRAFVDTGAPFSGVVTQLSYQLSLEGLPQIDEEQQLNIRGTTYEGTLYRAPIKIPATNGKSVEIEGPLFVAEQRFSNDLHPFLGLDGFFNSLRLSFDPFDKRLFFGQ